MRRRLLNWAAAGLLILSGAGVLVRLTVRDRFPLLALLNYAVPPSVAAGMVLLGGILYLRLGQRRRACCCGLALLCCLAFWHETTYISTSGPAISRGALVSPPLRVLIWNIADGDWGWRAVVDEIKAFDSDLVILGEAGRDVRDPEELRALWTQAMPGYNVSPTQHGLIILSRAPIESCQFGTLGGRGKYQHLVVSSSGGRLHIVQPEIPSNPFLSRGPMLEALRTVVEPLAGEPLLVAGDFNLTGNSVWFDTWRSFLTDAFGQNGEGYYLSWPVPFPVLDLDHAWASPRVGVQACALRWSWRSDHRPLTMQIFPRP